MTVDIKSKVAKPALLLAGCPKATVINLCCCLMIFFLFNEILLVILLIIMGQAIVFYKTFYNPYFLEQFMVYLRCRNRAANNTKEAVERYVA